MDVDLGDFSGDVPTLDMVDRVRRMLADSGADSAQVASLDPVIMAVLIRLIQINGRNSEKLQALNKKLDEHQDEVRQLKDQRVAMKSALKKFQYDESEVAAEMQDTASVQAAYENIFLHQFKNQAQSMMH